MFLQSQATSYVFPQTHATSYIFLQTHAISSIFLQTHATSYVFLQTQANLCISTVQLLYTVKEKGGKPDRKPFPFPMVWEIQTEIKSENCKSVGVSPFTQVSGSVDISSMEKNLLSTAHSPLTHSPLKTWGVNSLLNAKEVILSSVYCVNLYASSKTGIQGVFLKILRMAVHFYIQLFWGLTICPSIHWGVNSLLKSQSSFCPHVLHRTRCLLLNGSYNPLILSSNVTWSYI